MAKPPDPQQLRRGISEGMAQITEAFRITKETVQGLLPRITTIERDVGDIKRRLDALEKANRS